MTPAELQERLAAGRRPLMIDVREPEEYAEGHIPGVKLVPLGELPQRYHELDPAQEIVLVCRSGNRSGRAQEWLWLRGLRSTYNLVGGMLAWAGPVERE